MYLYTFQKGRPIQLDGLTLSICTSETYFQRLPNGEINNFDFLF